MTRYMGLNDISSLGNGVKACQNADSYYNKINYKSGTNLHNQNFNMQNISKCEMSNSSDNPGNVTKV